MTPTIEQTKKGAKDFAAFVTDVATAMKKHKVEDMLCVFGLNGNIRNTYIPLSAEGEMELYCKLSDGIHEWLQMVGFAKSGVPKHTGTLKINKQEIIEVPDSVLQLFEQGENSYRIIDYETEMDNNQSMQYFLECIGATDENIFEDSGTQVILKHPDRADMMVVDAGGLGDFFSHGFTVTEYNCG